MDEFDRSPAVGRLIRAISPATVRRRLRSAHQQYVFQRAIRQFLRDPAKCTDPTNELLLDLIYAWGNEGWSAFPEYLAACVENALSTRGAILECGSGLTTILLGLVATKQQRTVWTLENSREWGERVNGVVKRHHITGVRVCIRPLKDYGGFFWYDPPLDAMPRFSLVVCDGPPSQTAGGRYGLMPVMSEKLERGSIILLDDAGREHEALVAKRWQSEFDLDSQLLGSVRPFLRLTRR